MGHSQKNITDYVYWTTIDHLWIDTEGTEYSILPEMIRGGSLSVENHVEICQFNAELHGDLTEYGMSNESFDFVMRNLVEKSDYLPLFALAPASHIRAYFVNVHSHYCLTRYFVGRCP